MRINIDLEDLRALFEFARCGSFTLAARTLSISPSALSRRIAKAESAINGRLVERSTHASGLTRLGQHMVDRVEPLLRMMETQLAEAADMAAGRSGSLQVACISTLAQSVFPQALRQFHERYPGVRVSLRDSHGTQVQQNVLERHAEFGLTPLWAPHPELVSERVASDAYRLVCSARHPLARRKKMRWDELAPWKVLSFNPGSATRQQIDGVLRANKIALPWFDEVDALSTLMSHVEDAGMVAVLPALTIKVGAPLVSISLEAPQIDREIYLVCRHDVTLSEPAKYLQDRLRALISASA